MQADGLLAVDYWRDGSWRPVRNPDTRLVVTQRHLGEVPITASSHPRTMVMTRLRASALEFVDHEAMGCWGCLRGGGLCDGCAGTVAS